MSTSSVKRARCATVSSAEMLNHARTTGRSEADILREVLRYLANMRVVAWRNNVGAVSATYNGRTRLVRFGTPGLSDVIGIVPGTGQLFACELKSAKGRVSPHQQGFLAQVDAAGGKAFVARDVATVAKELGL